MIALATHLNRLYRKHFRVHLRDKGGHPPRRKQRLIAQIAKIQEKYNFTIFYIFQSNSKSNQTQHHHSTIITQSRLYEVNSSRYYKCKGLFTEEFQSIFRIAESSDSQSEDRISRSLQQQLETSERFKTINHPLLNTIGNNKRENSLKGSCHLRLSLKTTQMCESLFKLRTTIDHTGRMCNTLNLKMAHKEDQFRQSETIVNELFQVFIERRFKYQVKGIDDSLPTDTTELSLMNVEYKK